MVNFMYQLDWAKECHCFWVCLWECFWKQSAFESVDWVMKLPSHQCRQASSQPLRVQENKMAEKGWMCSLPWAETSFFFCPQTLELLVSGFLDYGASPLSPASQTYSLRWRITPATSPVLQTVYLDWTPASAFLFLQFMDSRLWGLLLWKISNTDKSRLNFHIPIIKLKQLSTHSLTCLIYAFIHSTLSCLFVLLEFIIK